MEAERKSAKNKWNDVQTERKDIKVKKHTTNKWKEGQTKFEKDNEW